MCQNHLADIGLAPPILHHYKIVAIFGSITHWGSNQYPLTCIITLYTTPQNRYKSRREEIIKEVIKRIVASFVGVSDFFYERLVESGIFQKTNQSLYDGEENILEDLYLLFSSAPIAIGD